MAKRKVPEVNAGSMADIAFLLLIFFLVATTMNVDSGIQRILPQIPPEDQPPIDIKQRNVLLVFVNKYDQINVAGEVVDITMLKDRAKAFVVNAANDPNWPEKDMTDIDKLGKFPVSKGVISLQNDRGTSYEMYIKVQNELTRAFNELREELSASKFRTKFENLDDEQKKAIQRAIPLKISEAEPRNIEGGR